MVQQTAKRAPEIGQKRAVTVREMKIILPMVGSSPMGSIQTIPLARMKSTVRDSISARKRSNKPSKEDAASAFRGRLPASALPRPLHNS
jgi:hypothetical protein